MKSANVRFALVAGEASGDILGADLMLALKKHYPNASFEGIGGDKMKALGFQSLFPLERLSVMGLIEPLKRLPELLSIRKKLKMHFIANKPNVFIGIDAPDFNLSLEKYLKQNNIKTVHYVSPTVWAWRKGRIKTIKKAVDLMLTLFPFETTIFQENQISFCCVGHPLADQIPFHSDKMSARQRLNIPLSKKVVALLPGSRAQELRYLAKDFIDTAKWLREKNNDICFVTSCANEARLTQLQTMMQENQFNGIQLCVGKTHDVIASSDAVLATSGTVTLEAMLIKRPTAVVYKTSAFTYAILKRMLNISYISLPNLLANKSLMPEFIQSDVVPSLMGEKILTYLKDGTFEEKLLPEFQAIHSSLRKNAGESAAEAIINLIKEDIHDCRSR